jgi:hypothetical protein
VDLPEYRIQNQREVALWYCLAHRVRKAHKEQRHARNERQQMCSEPDKSQSGSLDTRADSDNVKNNAEQGLRKTNGSGQFGVSNSLVALFTGLLVFIGFLQVWTFIHSDRAYLSVRGFTLKHGAISAGVPIIVLFDVRNTGRHPARVEDFRGELSGQLPRHPRQTDYEAPPSINVERFIPANDVFHSSMGVESGTPPPLIFRQSQINELNNGAHFYFRGFVTYDDGYQIPILHPARIFWFCAVYDPHAVGDSPLFRYCANDEYQYGD